MKYIFITCDVECHDLSKENLFLTGKINGKEYGLRKILELAKTNNVPVNFFLDVVECRKYGDEYVENIVKEITSYGQPVFFHIHPSYVMKDGRPNFYQYTPEEQKKVLDEGLSDYRRLVGTDETLVIRAGNYGIDQNYYDSLSSIGGFKKIIDLSYCYSYRWSHFYPSFVNSINRYKTITIFPNTRFAAFRFFHFVKYMNLDVESAFYSEMKSILKNSNLPCMVFTMHSWSFLRSFFDHPKTVRVNKRALRNFSRFIAFAKNNEYSFCRLDQVDFDQFKGCPDDNLNLSRGLLGALREDMFSFFRMHGTAMSNKKWFLIYLIFYCVLTLLLTGLIVFLVWKF
jgi:hypothetical protein